MGTERRPAKRALWLAVAAASYFASCTSEEIPPIVEITAVPIPSAIPTGAAEQLARLESVVRESPNRRLAVQDVFAALRALDYEAKRDWDLALHEWAQAVKLGEGRIGKFAFEKWVALYSRVLGPTSSSEVLGRLLLAETDQGRSSPYMAGSGLTSLETIMAEVERLVPEFRHVEADGKVARDIVLPSETGIPSRDPLLTKTAAEYCRSAGQHKSAWQEWAGSLDKTVFQYWQAKVAQCEGNDREAINLYKAVLPTLSRNEATATMAVSAAEALVALYRAAGDREAAANAYVILLKAFDKPGVSAEVYGEAPIDFLLRRINAALWAARYRAMIADYLNAKGYVQEAFDLIAKAYIQRPALSGRLRDKLNELKAEGYHVLAFRIAIEQGEYESALALNRLGLQISGLNTEWQERFKWFTGFYFYLGGHTDSALKAWEQLLAETSSDHYKEQLYFWLSRLYAAAGKEAESEFYYRTLVDEYPLSFYTIVAPRLAGMTLEPTWFSRWGTPTDLREQLKSHRKFDLKRFRKDGVVGPRLLRSEILLAAKLGDFATMAVKELADAVRKTYLVRSNVEGYIYLTRLLYEGADYHMAISLTSELVREVPDFWKDNRDQLLIYYPQPYADVFERYATQQFLDRELLFSITRQETSFRADARSGAGAIGLMQLIPPTAQRFAEEIGMPTEGLAERLVEPEVNVRLGSSYLRFLHRYYKGNDAAVFGAYNAGEFVMDTWIARRSHPDPMTWVELIPYSETKDYVKNVWRNFQVYRYLNSGATSWTEEMFDEPLDMAIVRAPGRKVWLF